MENSSGEKLRELYSFYWEIKSSVALYETNFNKIPAELLNEIRNAFDHVARCYVLYGLDSEQPDAAKIEQHLDKSLSHLERLHLDLYKLFILENKEQVDRLVSQIETDLRGIRERPYPLPEVTRFQGWLSKESLLTFIINH